MVYKRALLEILGLWWELTGTFQQLAGVKTFSRTYHDLTQPREKGANREPLLKAGADIVIEDFSQITSWHLNDFFLPNTGGWVVNFQGYDPKLQPLREVRYSPVLFTIQTNTLFLLQALCVLGNGYMATRGNVEEAVADSDEHYPGILHNKFYLFLRF